MHETASLLGIQNNWHVQRVTWVLCLAHGSQVGPAVLGSLQPRVLMVSTPNVDYNQILTHLGSNLLGNGLRNSDHRFEWYATVLAPDRA
jgi:hypothetical protein